MNIDQQLDFDCHSWFISVVVITPDFDTSKSNASGNGGSTPP